MNWMEFSGVLRHVFNPMREGKCMSRFSLPEFAAVGETSAVPTETDGVKASQVPEPKTYHLLCMLPQAKEAYDSGILKADKTMQFEELLSPVLFVAKMGPDAFKDEKRFPSGPSCKVGDFVIVRPNSGTRMKIHGTEWRLLNDDSVEATVQDPRGISRV